MTTNVATGFQVFEKLMALRNQGKEKCEIVEGPESRLDGTTIPPFVILSIAAQTTVNSNTLKIVGDKRADPRNRPYSERQAKENGHLKIIGEVSVLLPLDTTIVLHEEQFRGMNSTQVRRAGVVWHPLNVTEETRHLMPEMPNNSIHNRRGILLLRFDDQFWSTRRS